MPVPSLFELAAIKLFGTPDSDQIREDLIEPCRQIWCKMRFPPVQYPHSRFKLGRSFDHWWWSAGSNYSYTLVIYDSPVDSLLNEHYEMWKDEHFDLPDDL